MNLKTPTIMARNVNKATLEVWVIINRRNGYIIDSRLHLQVANLHVLFESDCPLNEVCVNATNPSNCNDRLSPGLSSHRL